jgi:hypothetical protein
VKRWPLKRQLLSQHRRWLARVPRNLSKQLLKKPEITRDEA